MSTTIVALLLVAATAGEFRPGEHRDTIADPAGAKQPDDRPARPLGVLVIPRLTGPVRLDGPSDEPAWQAVEPLPSVGHSPTFGADPSERTEFRVAHDGQYLYAAGRLYDAYPAGIQATTLRRDEGSFSNDWFAINLDTFHDGETVLTFATNPAGVRTDVVYVNDAQNGADFNWNALWDAAVEKTEQGWFAEIRIPLSSLRFQLRDGEVIMGMTLWRRIARKNEMITYPAISPQWGWTSPFKASQAHPVVLEGVHGRNPLRITPYLLAGGGSAQHERVDATGYHRARQRVGEIGLDLKYGLTSNLTLDLTLNPDFAQVEADDAQVNLSRYSLFFPEKRLFFQERASVFTFPMGRNDRLFHSRRIGLSDGEPVPIQGGARLVGRAGGWDIGAMTMRSAAVAAADAETFGVLRLRRQVLNPSSYLGAIATLQSGTKDDLAYGLDGSIRVLGEDYVSFQLAETRTSEAVGNQHADDRLFARLHWERRGIDGLTYGIDFARSGAAFDPSLGFVARRDYTKLGSHAGYGWRPGAGSPLLRHDVTLLQLAFWSASSGTLESLRIGPQWRAETKSGRELVVGLQAEQENLEGELTLSPGLVVPVGMYRFGNGYLTYLSPGGSPGRVSLGLDGGGFYNGWQSAARITPMWNVTRHLELSAMAQISHLEMPGSDERLTARLARLRARVMLDTRLSAAALVQFSSLSDALTANLRLRYNPRESDDLYLVYNAVWNTDFAALEPHRTRLDSDALLLKYSRTVGFGR